MGITQKRRISAKTAVAAVVVALLLSGCETLGVSPDTSAAETAGQTGSTSVEKDVERPDVFSVTENALWDGRPSLGGVWVAYPATIDPERVIIRNGANGKSVIGALFRRERDNPGPRIQLSSDAAVALGVIAGSPTEISIVVLRRESVVVDAPPAPETGAVTDENMVAPARRAVVAAPVAAPAPAVASGAGIAAIVEQTLADVPATEEAEPAPVNNLRKPYIQIGTFAEREQAEELVTLLANEGVQAEIQANDPENPTLYRVISGPVSTRRERTARLRIIKGLGYIDAFFVR